MVRAATLNSNASRAFCRWNVVCIFITQGKFLWKYSVDPVPQEADTIAVALCGYPTSKRAFFPVLYNFILARIRTSAFYGQPLSRANTFILDPPIQDLVASTVFIHSLQLFK